MIQFMTSITFEHLKSLLFNKPHAIDPDRFAVILDALAGRTGIAFDLEQLGDANTRIDHLPAGAQRAMRGPAKPSSKSSPNKLYPFADGTAIIQVHGTLVNRGAWVGPYSGLTSYEGLRHQVRAAMADEEVTSVVLDIDSPGGQAAGAFELAAAVRELSAKKPVTAVINDTAASAAYAIASAATKIMIAESAIAGSIGVVLMHLDHSARLDKAGIKPTLLHAGARKVDGNPYQPLPDGVKQNLQAEIDKFYQMFVDTVARGRPKLTPASIRATEAAVFIGRAAIEAGLADEIGDLEKALAQLQSAKTEPGLSGLHGVRPAEAAPGAASAPAVDYALLASILALPEAVGRNELARRLAEQGTAVHVAQVVLGAFPTEAQSEAERSARAAELAARETEAAARAAADKKASAEAAERERKKAIEQTWNDAVDEIGARMRGRR